MDQRQTGADRWAVKPLLLIIVVVVSIGSSYFKWLDSYSSDYTDEAIKQAAISYATARGINALVSVLQTSTIEGDAIFISGSVSIGELLDPINDLIERFSTVMTVVLGSLAVQKILFLMTGHDVFLHVLAVSGLLVIGSLWIGLKPIFNWAVRFFAVTLFLRFSFVVVLALNGVVDRTLIWNETDRFDQNVKSFQTAIDPPTEIPEDSASSGPQGAKTVTKTARDWVTDLDVPGIEQKVERSINDFMMLMAIYLIKTIALPLLFFYLLLQGTRQLWRLDYQAFMTSTNGPE